MANALHSAVKKAILDQNGGLDLLADTIKVSICDTTDHAMSAAADDFYDDISAAVVATGTLGTKTTTAGAFDSADVTLSAVTGDPCEYIELWSDTAGAAGTDPLIAAYDTATSGLPVTPNGGDIVIAPHASGWLSL